MIFSYLPIYFTFIYSYIITILFFTFFHLSRKSCRNARRDAMARFRSFLWEYKRAKNAKTCPNSSDKKKKLQNFSELQAT